MESKNDKNYIDLLRRHGLQVTYQRLAIYEALCSAEGHPSVDVIHQQVKRRFPMISLGTVYKTLERFCEVGLINKVSPITEVARYDAEPGHHHYMICLACESIQNADDIIEESEASGSDQCGVKPLRQQVFLYGYCAACKDKFVDSQA